MTGEVLERKQVAELDTESLQSTLKQFTGLISQIPPAFSAVRIDGRRAYKLARAGSAPELPPREVTVDRWIIHGIQDDIISLSVTVSSGTYIRSLARDIGMALGVGGAASSIRRTSVGALPVSEASAEPDEAEAFIGMLSALRDMPSICLNAEECRQLSHGRPIGSGMLGRLALADDDGLLLGVGEGDGEYVRPLCVLMGGENG